MMKNPRLPAVVAYNWRIHSVPRALLDRDHRTFLPLQVLWKTGMWLLLVFLISVPFTVLAQNTTTVKGVVTDGRTNNPLAGVSVVVKGTNRGTATNNDGEYTIAAKSGEVLQFSYAGYEAHEVTVGNQSTINYTMKESASKLDEIVVIGYGTVRKKDLMGSVASVSGKTITATPVPNVAQAMQGKLAGVNVVTQDGRPGADVSIRVRGGGSISQSNDPLILIDGIPGSLNDIPPDQVKSIDVLKDASSTAIYGARGANGVVLVTTKGAQAGKTMITYNGYVKFNTPAKYLKALSPYDYLQYVWPMRLQTVQRTKLRLSSCTGSGRLRPTIPAALKPTGTWRQTTFKRMCTTARFPRTTT